MEFDRKIRYGMVGGGQGGFIGAVHRKAAAMDGGIELVCGAFSSSDERCRMTGKELFLDPERVYSSYQEMAQKEGSLPKDRKIDFVSIVTPNFLHYPVAKAFMEQGINIVCEKPLAISNEEADELCFLSKKYNLLFAVTYNYTKYTMVRQAKELVSRGELGKLERIVVEYTGDFLLKSTECENRSPEELWRMLPEKGGRSFSIGDIGSHAENLAAYITGLNLISLCATTNSYSKGMDLEDESSILIKYEDGVRGVLLTSAVAAGEKNNLNIRIYGNKASLLWDQNSPNELIVRFPDKPDQVFGRDTAYLYPRAKHNILFPQGLPEGHMDTFANIYASLARVIIAREKGVKPHEFDLDFPTVVDGARGVHFINCAVDSSQAGTWMNMEFDPGKY